MESPDGKTVPGGDCRISLLRLERYAETQKEENPLTGVGFDGSLMGSLLPIQQFRDTFGSGLVGSQASLIQGMYTIGGVSALPFVGFVLDTWGRRMGMFVGSLAVIVGTILGGTANEMGQLLASRFFLGECQSVFTAFKLAADYLLEPRLGILDGSFSCSRLRG